MYPLKIKEKYNPANLETQSNRFSVAYLGTYISGDYQEGTGSHPGVDIVPETKNQEVFSPLDGTVHKTGEDGAYGKYIIIEHTNVPHPDDMKKTTTLYSCFQHLSEVSVKDGQVLKEGDSIGRTGNTGNSFGEHLHFQIDRVEAPFHAYWPFTGAEAREAGTTFSGAVNIALGIQKARMYTLNPLVYLDKVDEYRKNPNTSTVATGVVEKKPEIISPVEEKIVLETKIETPIAKTSHIPLETVLTSNQADIVVSPDHIESTIVDNQKPQTEKIETVLPQEKKLEMIHSQEDIIVRNPIIDDITSQIDSESQKKNFKDIKTTDSLYDYISYLSEKGFLAGFGDNTFRPNNSITRAEFLKLIFLVSSTPLSTDTKDYFSDIKVGWQKRYINTGVHLGIVSTQNKKFNPNGSVTRSEALKMMIVLFVGEISSLFTEELFDVSGSEWYAKYIQYAIDNHLLEVSGNHFFPHKNITRYEVVSILKKLSYNK